MNYKDVALLNDSLDRLGDGLLRRKMLEMQQQDRKADRGFQEKRLGIEQGQVDAQKAHWKEMEQKAGLQATFKEMVDTGTRMRTGMAVIAKQVQAGTDAAVANEYFRGSMDTLPPEVKNKLLASSPEMKMAYDGKFDWKSFKSAEDKDIKPKEFDLSGRKGAYNPDTGHFQLYQDTTKWAPEDLIQLRTIEDSLQNIDRETIKHPDSERARAMNAQRNALLKEKQLLVDKYSRPDNSSAAPARNGSASSKQLDAETAAKILKEAGGDRDKARKLATERGYKF